MLRLHFTPDDRGKVRLAREADPLWETCLGVRALRVASPPHQVRAWRSQVAPQLDERMLPLFELISAGGGFPDFLTPALAGGGVRERVQALLDVPTATVRAQARCERLSPWCARLVRGDAFARHELGGAVHAFHEVATAPVQGLRDQWFSADRAAWAATAADGGVDALLAHLMPGMTWHAPHLTYQAAAGVPTNLVEVDLAGRGLVIYPSRLVEQPLVLDVPKQEPVLVVPGGAELIGRHGKLSALLGRTRAVVLAALCSPASTTELARRTGISVASASEHASVLRGAGLIATHRDLQAVRHSLTSLGDRLLTETGDGLDPEEQTADRPR